MPVRRRGDVWWVDVQIGGQRIRRSAGPGATREEAKKLEAQIRAKHRRVQRGAHTLDDALARWLDGEARSLKSRKQLLYHVAVLRPFCAGKLLADAPDVAESFAKKYRDKVTNATINRKLAILRRICRLAYRVWHWLPEPIDQRIIMLQENNKRGTFLRAAQVEELAGACADPVAADMIRLAAFTGLRRSELFRAEYRDGLLYLAETKSGKPRAIPVPERVRAIAARLPLPITPTHLRKHFEAARKAAGLAVRFHDLRHTFASLLIQAGGSLSTVQELMGHSTIAITKDLYGHLETDHLAKTVRLLDKL